MGRMTTRVQTTRDIFLGDKDIIMVAGSKGTCEGEWEDGRLIVRLDGQPEDPYVLAPRDCEEIPE